MATGKPVRNRTRSKLDAPSLPVPAECGGGDYVVGYRKPPKSGQFKPGQSGNPNGRTKGTKNLKTDLQEEMGERITVTESGKRKKLSKQRAMLKSTVARAVSGDMRAVGIVIGMMERYVDDPTDVNTSTNQRSSTDEDILQAFKAEILKEQNNE